MSFVKCFSLIKNESGKEALFILLLVLDVASTLIGLSFSVNSGFDNSKSFF